MILALALLTDGLPRSLGDDVPRGSVSIVQRLAVPDGGDYEDLFDLAYGAGLEADYLVSAAPGWGFGPYAGIDVLRYSGERESVNGVELEADDLTILNLLFGIKSVNRIDPAFLIEARLGVGFSHFFSTDASISAGPDIELFDASTEIAGEAGVRAVFEPGSRVRLTFGAGARLRGGAEEGRDAPVRPGTMAEYLLELGIGLRF